MTIQLATIRHGQSKAALRAALTTMPERVRFYDPAIVAPAHGGHFTGADMAPGERFPCVLDSDTRRRFAIVHRVEGGWRVT